MKLLLKVSHPSHEEVHFTAVSSRMPKMNIAGKFILSANQFNQHLHILQEKCIEPAAL